jgi:threonine dehydratase
MTMLLPTIADIRAAAQRIAGTAHRTPVMTSATLDEIAGARLYFKCESLQRGGAFKIRGAYNAVSQLTDDEARRGVVTHSSGNHAAALALAAQLRGIPAHIVMPENAPRAKRVAVESYGGRIVLCAPTLDSRESTAARVQSETGAILVHPFDDPRVIAGQGTVGLEFLEQCPQLDVLVAPVSGGGLLSGIALAAAALRPQTEVVGSEPELADEAARSLQAGRLIPSTPGNTIADGLRATLSERTFSALRRHVLRIDVVREDQIISAMRLIWERLKLVVEASGAVPLAAILSHPTHYRGRQVGVVLSGGNLDLDRLPWQNP